MSAVPIQPGGPHGLGPAPKLTPSTTRTFECVYCGGKGTITRTNPAWLRYIRERAGVTLRGMAKRLGVSAAYVCDVEKGRRAIPDSWRAEYVKARKP